MSFSIPCSIWRSQHPSLDRAWLIRHRICYLPLLSSDECCPSVTLLWSPRRRRSPSLWSTAGPVLTAPGPTSSSLRRKLLTILDCLEVGNNSCLLNWHSFISGEYFQTITGECIKKSKFPLSITLPQEIWYSDDRIHESQCIGEFQT